MTEQTDKAAIALGERDEQAREAETLAQFLQRARSLGFSVDELARLRATYGRELGIERNEHFSGSSKD